MNLTTLIIIFLIIVVFFVVGPYIYYLYKNINTIKTENLKINELQQSIIDSIVSNQKIDKNALDLLIKGVSESVNSNKNDVINKINDLKLYIDDENKKQQIDADNLKKSIDSLTSTQIKDIKNALEKIDFLSDKQIKDILEVFSRIKTLSDGTNLSIKNLSDSTNLSIKNLSDKQISDIKDVINTISTLDKQQKNNLILIFGRINDLSKQQDKFIDDLNKKFNEIRVLIDLNKNSSEKSFMNLTNKMVTKEFEFASDNEANKWSVKVNNGNLCFNNSGYSFCLNSLNKTKKYIYVSWLDQPTEIQKMATLNDGKNVYMIFDGKYTKMVTDEGVAKYYVGNLDQFNANNWGAYIDVGQNYKLVTCNINNFANSNGECVPEKNDLFSINKSESLLEKILDEISKKEQKFKKVQLYFPPSKIECLHIAEIEIYDHNDVKINITDDMITMSSVYTGDGIDMSKNKIIDKDIDTISHTNCGNGENLSIIFNEPQTISKVKIVNRKGPNSNKIIGAFLSLEEINGSKTEIEITNNNLVYNYILKEKQLVFVEPQISKTVVAEPQISQTSVAQISKTVVAEPQISQTSVAQISKTVVAEPQISQTSVAQISKTVVAEPQISQISVALRKLVLPIFTSDTSHSYLGYETSASSIYWNNIFYPYKAFLTPNPDTTFWHSLSLYDGNGRYTGDKNTQIKMPDGTISIRGEWIQIKLPPVTIKAYGFLQRSNVLQRFPKNWLFLGSNDGTTWMTIESRAIETNPLTASEQIYNINNNNSYSFYRIVFLSLFGPDSVNMSLNLYY